MITWMFKSYKLEGISRKDWWIIWVTDLFTGSTVASLAEEVQWKDWIILVNLSRETVPSFKAWDRKKSAILIAFQIDRDCNTTVSNSIFGWRCGGSDFRVLVSDSQGSSHRPLHLNNICSTCLWDATIRNNRSAVRISGSATVTAGSESTTTLHFHLG
jgi:hypothetical protein